MLRDNLVGLIEPMFSSAGANPLALCIAKNESSDDRPHALKIPAPKGAESTLTENVPSPFHAEPRQVPNATASMQSCGCDCAKLLRIQFHQDSPDTTYQTSDGRWRHRSALGRSRLGSSLGVLREGGKSWVTNATSKQPRNRSNDPPSQPLLRARCFGSSWSGDRCGCGAPRRLAQHRKLEVMKWLIFLNTSSFEFNGKQLRTEVIFIRWQERRTDAHTTETCAAR